jgi:hypothetical protein
MSAYGTRLRISNVRFHGGYQGHNGHVADIAKMALMTHLGSRATYSAVMQNRV